MNDERIMETMMDALPDLPTPGPNYTQGFVKHLAVRDQLAALRAAGFDVYPIGDAVPVVRTSVMALTYAVTADPDEADAFVVPVGGDS